MKKLFRFFDRDRETLQSVALINFFEDDQVSAQVEWKTGKNGVEEWIRLILFYYARIMFELAELNENRVARELMGFISRIAARLSHASGKMQIPLGKLRYEPNPTIPSRRVYQAMVFAKKNGSHRLELKSVIGKEKFYLPASFLALLQCGILHINDVSQAQLAHGLERLHQYYRYKRDFWDSVSVTEGPAFALSHEVLTEPDPDFNAV
ncbi:MAG TPA: hypothetical protein DCY27_00585 [Desulfobacterales bacterium]|nr:hypothetical protein [Desulfobacterales bacterium]